MMMILISNQLKGRRMKQTITYTALLASVILFNACGGGSIDTTDAVSSTSSGVAVEGILVDSPVSGAEYHCGKIVEMTQGDGRFTCNTLPVTFYAGGIKLGEITQLPADGMVTPQDLLGVSRDTYDSNVSKLARFLQSMDDDGDIDTRITFDQMLLSALKTKQGNIQTMTVEQMLTLLEEAGAVNIVTPDEAMTHLREQLEWLVPVVTDDTPSSGDIPTDDTTTTEDEDVPTDEVNGTTTTTLDDAVKQAYLDLINEARSEGRECGEYGYFPAVDALTWNEKLYSAAYEHSQDMAQSDTFSHTGSGEVSDLTAQTLHPGEGSRVGERIEYNGYTDWQRYGENIAAGTVMDEAVEAMEGWLESPGHCANIMKAEFKEVGMAVYYNENSHYRYYWTQDFGTLR
jgi:uncharacterized protein YkwD